jgi:hypothetical protein
MNFASARPARAAAQRIGHWLEKLLRLRYGIVDPKTGIAAAGDSALLISLVIETGQVKHLVLLVVFGPPAQLGPQNLARLVVDLRRRRWWRPGQRRARRR